MSGMSVAEKRLVAAALRRIEKEELHLAFDPAFPDSRPNPKQQMVLADIERIRHRFVTAGNQSGKSQLAAREVAWILNDNHPHWTRPSRWGHEPLLILIAGQDRKQMEIELWEKKLSLFLDKSEWKPVRSGQTLQYVVNRRTDDKIVFLTHSDSSESNRKHMQGYVANYVWLDEMPGSATILEELQRRVDAKEGYLLATFTPKFRNDAIRKVIDAGKEPLIKRYTMSKLDNPLYKDRIAEELALLDGYPDSYKNAILYGDWYTGDNAVYEWSEKMIQAPENYSPSWRHVESVDPALKSKFGYTRWAEQPSTGVWYLVEDSYLEGIFDPQAMVDAVAQKGQGFNVVRRVTDYAPWFTGLALKQGLHYVSPRDKNSRKAELIKGFQAAMSSGKIRIAPHCTRLISEIQSCQWSETTDKMINASSYHLLDCAQYFVDCAPKYDPSVAPLGYYHALKAANTERKKVEHAKQTASARGYRVQTLTQWSRGRQTIKQVGHARR